jgi:hypothetical protein
MGFKNITIDDVDKPNQPLGKPLPDYDHARGTTHERPKRRGRLPWYIVLTLTLAPLAIVGYLVVRFVAFLSDVSARTSWLDVYLVALLKSVLMLAPVVALALGCYWLYLKAAHERIIRLQNNMPVAR